MSDILLFFAFIPVYIAFLVAGAVAIAVLTVGAIIYIPSRMIWALATGRDLGPGW